MPRRRKPSSSTPLVVPKPTVVRVKARPFGPGRRRRPPLWASISVDLRGFLGEDRWNRIRMAVLEGQVRGPGMVGVKVIVPKGQVHQHRQDVDEVEVWLPPAAAKAFLKDLAGLIRLRRKGARPPLPLPEERH